MKVSDANKRFESLRNEYISKGWQSSQKDIRDFILPTRGCFEGEQPNSGTMIDHKKILDSEGTQAAEYLASGLASGLTPPSRPWFRFGLEDKDLENYKAVREWLARAQERTYAIFARSNIYTVLNSLYAEIPFGTATAAVLNDRRTLIRGRNFTAGQYYLGVGPDGQINTFAYPFEMTVAQLVEAFGLDNVSGQVKALYENRTFDKWISCRQLILPNALRDVSKFDNRNMEFSSYIWETGKTDKFLQEKGFEDFPVLGARWEVTGNTDAYGKGPGWKALGDVKQLQIEVKDKLIILAKTGDPPVQQSSDYDVNTLPGGITNTNGDPAGVSALYQISTNIGAINESIASLKRGIREKFYTDLFLMISQDNRSNVTAREIVERHEEKMLMLGPVVLRVKDDVLDPLINRTFNMELRAGQGVFGEIPEELEGHDIKIDYISTLAQAQKMVGTTALEQTSRFVGSIAAIKPDVIDVYDWDKMAREYGDMTGVSPELIRDENQVNEKREADRKAQEQAQALQNIPQSVQAAKTLSETEVGENSALQALMGGQ